MPVVVMYPTILNNSCLTLTFMTLALLKIDYRIAILKSRISFKLGLLYFLTIQFSLCIFDRIITEVVFHPIRWYTISFCLVTNNFHFDFFIKVKSVKFLCYIVTFPFVISKCFMKRYFEMM